MRTDIRKTITIPASRRLYLELPENAPAGRAEIIIRPLNDAASADDFDEYFGCFKDCPIGNRDSVIMVREQRDEW